jgi:hypothetical protein
MNDIQQPAADEIKTFSPFKIIIPVLFTLLAISLMAQWYASNVTLPRYCENPEKALHNLDRLLTPDATIDNDQRRDYMISAKLLFLHPQQEDETVDEYKQRLRYLLLNECQTSQ